MVFDQDWTAFCFRKYEIKQIEEVNRLNDDGERDGEFCPLIIKMAIIIFIIIIWSSSSAVVLLWFHWESRFAVLLYLKKFK